MKKDDTLWKGLLEDLFEEFTWFIFKEQAEIFDFSKNVEFLNNELAQFSLWMKRQNILNM